MQSVFILVITVLISFVLLFSVNFSESLISSLGNGSVWGFSDAQIKVTRERQAVGGISSELIGNKIKENENVEEVVSGKLFRSSKFIKPEGTTINVIGKGLAGNLDEVGYENVKGFGKMLLYIIAALAAISVILYGL